MGWATKVFGAAAGVTGIAGTYAAISSLLETFERDRVADTLQDEAAKPDGKPAEFLFAKIAQNDPSKYGPETEGGKKLATITGDPRLMGALNAAMIKDPSVRDGIAKSIRNPDPKNPLNPDNLITALQSNDARQTMAGVLQAVADRDDLGFAYLEEVGNAAMAANDKDGTRAAKGRKDLRGALAKADIKNPKLEMASAFDGMMQDPKQLLAIFTDPHKFFGNLAQNLGLEGPQAEAAQRMFTMAANFIEAMGGDQAKRRTGSRLVSHFSRFFQDISGANNGPDEYALADGKTPEPASLRTSHLTGDAGNVKGPGISNQFDLAAMGLVPNAIDMHEVAKHDARNRLTPTAAPAPMMTG